MKMVKKNIVNLSTLGRLHLYVFSNTCYVAKREVTLGRLQLPR